VLKSVEAVRRHVADERRKLQDDVFESPPSDWLGFQRMLGMYQQLKQLSEELKLLTNPEDQ
jgi:hypothetical protein